MTNTKTVEKKITKKEMFALIAERVQDDAEMVAFLNHEIELLNRKASGKKTATSEEQKALINNIIEAMTKEPNRLFKCGELAKLLNLNPQKVTPALKKMVEEGIIEMIKDKRFNVYQLVKE